MTNLEHPYAQLSPDELNIKIYMEATKAAEWLRYLHNHASLWTGGAYRIILDKRQKDQLLAIADELDDLLDVRYGCSTPTENRIQDVVRHEEGPTNDQVDEEPGSENDR